MRNFYLLIILLIGVFCYDYRKPSAAAKKCMEKKMGKENTKKLLESLRKYHRTNGKATILDFILEKRPELKDVAEKCLLKITKKRRLDKENKSNIEQMEQQMKDLFESEILDYYMKALLKDQKTKNAILSELNENGNQAIDECKKFLPSEEICKMVIDLMIKTINKKSIDKK